MRIKVKMCHFADGECKTVKDAEKFLDNWMETAGNPCSVCGEDKSKCRFYKELKDKGVFGKGDRVERRSKSRNS